MKNDDTNEANESSPVVFVSEKDLDASVRNQIEAIASGTRILGGDEETSRVLFDAIPAAVLKRIRSMIPGDFVMSEVSMKLGIDGTLFGVTVGGNVVVKMTPKV